MERFVITVERGFGSGGKTIAYEVAEKLGVPCYNGDIVKMASDWSGLSAESFVNMNEKHRVRDVSRQLEKLDDGMMSPTGFLMNGKITDENLFLCEAQIIKGLAQTQNCVIVGYAANYILRKEPHVFSVNVQAPRHVCVKEIEERFVMSENAAATQVAEIDMQRSGFYRYFTGKDWLSYKDFDVILNSHRLGRENCADMIISMMQKKLNIHTSEEA